MVFGSEQSMRLAMDKFPKIDLHGQNPVVTSYTKHNLSVFEKAAGSDNQATARPRTEEMQTMKVSGGNCRSLYVLTIFSRHYWCFGEPLTASINGYTYYASITWIQCTQ